MKEPKHVLDGPLYLSPKVKLEPLIERWPLWPYLVPPAQHALNLAFRQIPNLQSFVEDPETHAAAAGNPRLFGGSFVALSTSDVDAVRNLLDDTSVRCRPLLEFARDLMALDSQLQKTATGYSLDQYYQDLPATLAGLVELVYDLNNRPKIRLMEALIYGSALDDARKEAICLHVVDDGDRPFFMSTPLLDASNRLFIDARYTDPIIDELAAARLMPVASNRIHDLLSLRSNTPSLPEGLFTSEAPVRQDPEYCGDGVRVRFFGHACVLVQTDKTSILVDPSAAWQRDDVARLTFADLPDRIDYVVLTHSHQDHLVAELLLQLRTRVGAVVVPPADRGNIADPSMRMILKRLGYENIVSLEHFESVRSADCEIIAVPFVGEHGGLDIASKQCVIVTAKGQKMLFMVDSDAVDPRLTERIAERVGEIDTAFIGMECCGAPMKWLYGPLLSAPLNSKDNQSRRFSGSNADRAWAAITALGCRTAYIYAMGQEPWMRHLMGLVYSEDSIQLKEVQRFIERCNVSSIRSKLLYGSHEETLEPSFA
jgi:L-ascorbate metabolism protein UlaG (beta-lactamase superfamily)